MDAESGVFTGYAAVFEQIDQGRDVISRGAFSRSLRERGTQTIKLLWQHDPKSPIGRLDMVREDGHGLFIQARLSLESIKGRDAFALLRSGAVDGLSIGYRVREALRDVRMRTRRLSDVDLWEVSLVTFPMQTAARVRAVNTMAGAMPRVMGRNEHIRR